MQLGISQRHLSFVELGRSRPSRELLLSWLDALEVPLMLRNEALAMVGYAPAFDASPLDADSLAQAREALSRLLVTHQPMPGLLLNSRWDVIAANSGVAWLLDAVGSSVAPPGPYPRDESEPLNLLDLATGDLGAAILNLDEVAASLIGQLRHEAVAEPALRPRVSALAAMFPGGTSPVLFPPTLITRYATRHGELAFLSMFTTFGVPHSVTLASLRIELMFPADDVTRRAVEAGEEPGS